MRGHLPITICPGTAVAGKALLAVVVLGSSAAAATPPAGCFGTYDINVCYSPWKVISAEPGYSGVVMRKGPFPDADPIYNANTNLPVVIGVNHHFARCSLRDGTVAADCPDPGPRPSVNGYIWSYWPDYAKQGWVPYKVGGVTYAAEAPAYTGTLCGPAKFDFDCRYPHEACALYHGCGGSPPPSSTVCPDPTFNEVIPVGTTPGELSQEKYYLRYGADSTTFGWLVPGDVVRRDCYTTSGTLRWSCVVVECAQYLPNGCRGWVRSDALGPALDPSEVTPCFPALPCPVGNVPCHAPFADADGDEDVDQDDFGVFQQCLTGPAGGILPGCECFDRENPTVGDGDVDQSDFDAFAQCLSGPGVPAVLDCGG